MPRREKEPICCPLRRSAETICQRIGVGAKRPQIFLTDVAVARHLRFVTGQALGGDAFRGPVQPAGGGTDETQLLTGLAGGLLRLGCATCTDAVAENTSGDGPNQGQGGRYYRHNVRGFELVRWGNPEDNPKAP